MDNKLTQRPMPELVKSFAQSILSDDRKTSAAALGAWFLGPKGENKALLAELVQKAVEAHCLERETLYASDPEWLTQERKEKPSYKNAQEVLTRELDALLKTLNGSIPFSSYRYQGHMLWDVTLPSVLGYFAAMLFNQNNVAAEASPVTTVLEMRVAEDLCRMLGYPVPERSAANLAAADLKYGTNNGDAITPWGHVTCDGSVANNESLWAARNLKYLPLGIAAALKREAPLKPALGISVQLPCGTEKALVELSTWELLNLDIDIALALSERIQNEYEFDAGVDIESLLNKYTIQNMGLTPFYRQVAREANDPVICAPATSHYSWPKGCALLGLGADSMIHIKVDLDARMDIRDLRKQLDSCLRDRRPVIMVVAVLGTTEESAVDPLAELLKERQRYRKQGLTFWLHVDAAWGGYFASMMREPHPEQKDLELDKTQGEESSMDDHQRLFAPRLVMNEYVQNQYSALPHSDSITVDPHKAGYVPYPAGALCYRNSAARHLVAFTAPVVYHGEADPSMGLYGIEGSKPGAAPAAVYLSHRVIPTDSSGYGRILGRCMWNSKRFYCALLSLPEPQDPFILVPLQRLPAEKRTGSTNDDIQKEIEKIKNLPLENQPLLEKLNKDEDLRRWYSSLGSDQVIISYAFNFKDKNGKLNTSPHLLNQLNTAIFSRLSLLSITRNKSGIAENHPPLYLTKSTFDEGNYGAHFLAEYKRRLGVCTNNSESINFLISTTMNPWLTDPEGGTFIPKLMKELRKTVLEEIQVLLCQQT
ncbi:Glutamate decarboxylase and related PLP-dependent proteins [Alteromonadaceae bacterium Bs31]|nr:Glutamate decarboxylase and related PLP-dependent proteins [Alteromonadaceae bacterium Bs31]